jgi:predicted amidophosphoribosyltransferase
MDQLSRHDCPECGAQVESTALACPHCGLATQRAVPQPPTFKMLEGGCPACKGPVAEEAMACPHCGLASSDAFPALNPDLGRTDIAMGVFYGLLLFTAFVVALALAIWIIRL